jgi:hypothetical protein
MKRLAIVLLATVAVGAQQPPDESNLPTSETRIPPGDYCKKAGVPIGQHETRAHPCECTFTCTVDQDGRIVEHEGATCQAFCHKNGRRCTCHVEEPCPGGDGGNARMDMGGHVVRVNVRRRTW